MAREGEGLPVNLGLCPAHGGEFYMPLDDRESLDCPVAGCEHQLVIYQRLPELRPPTDAELERARKLAKEHGW